MTYAILWQRPVAELCARVRVDDEVLGCCSLLFAVRELSAPVATRPATVVRPLRARGLSFELLE